MLWPKFNSVDAEDYATEAQRLPPDWQGPLLHASLCTYVEDTHQCPKRYL